MVQQQITTTMQVYIQMETTNQSFIDMHYYLKRVGVRNNDFFLCLYNKNLAGIDPRDPMLSQVQKRMVLQEIMTNYWYFLREVVRIPQQGSSASGGTRYKLDRASLAIHFLYILNYNMYVELPRQVGKTTAARVRYLYVYNFGTTNSEIMFIHKAHQGSKENLNALKELRDALPSYLRMDSATGINGQKLKVPNTIEKMEHPLNHNRIVTFPSARSEDAADKLGRGCTQPIQFYDEFAFIPYNKTVYASAIPAFGRASLNAAANNAPYGIYIASTPGDPTTSEGQFALSIINTATRWDESYFDYSYEQLEELRKANTKSSFFYIKFTYRQLGFSEEWFSQICTYMQNDWPKIRREILLEWAVLNENAAFNSEDLDIIKNFCREPIRTLKFGRVGQYLFDVYEDIDLRYPPIIGVDVSGAAMRDSSAITIIDSRTTKVVATFHCNYIPQDDLADLIYVLVNQYMPLAVVNVELNGGFGRSVIQRLVKTNVKKNLYFEIKDKVIEETVTGHMVTKRNALVKCYGLNSNREVRARLIELLYDRVNYHKDKFIAPILHQEMTGMVVKRSGKVEHSDQTHDDQVFSYLMALYVWYDGKNVMENWNLVKNTLRTDEDEEIISGDIERDSETETVPLEALEVISDDDVQLQLQYINDKKRGMLSQDFEALIHKREDEQVKAMMGTDPVFRKAINNVYNYEDSPETRVSITLPDSIYTDDDELPEYDVELHGNLYGSFMNDVF